MKCQVCGSEIPDQAKFCNKCGSKQNPIGAENTKMQTPVSQETIVLKPAVPKKEVTPKKKGSKLLLLILLCLLLCAGAGVGGYFVFQAIFKNEVELETEKEEEDSLGAWGKSDSEDDEEEEAKEGTEEATEEETKVVEETEPTEATASTEASLGYSIEPTTAPTVDYSISPTTAPTMTAPNGDFILPDSASKYLTEADLYGLTADQLRIARNELYARHGRMFNDETLQTYFNGKSWYNGTIAPNNFDETNRFNDYEKKNLILIKEREALLGN